MAMSETQAGGTHTGIREREEKSRAAHHLTKPTHEGGAGCHLSFCCASFNRRRRRHRPAPHPLIIQTHTHTSAMENPHAAHHLTPPTKEFTRKSKRGEEAAAPNSRLDPSHTSLLLSSSSCSPCTPAHCCSWSAWGETLRTAVLKSSWTSCGASLMNLRSRSA